MRKITIGITIFVVLVAITCFAAFKLIDNSSRFTAVIMSVHGDYVIVEPVTGEAILRSGDRIGFSTGRLDDIGAAAGDTVNVKYTGFVQETYPAQIDAVRWSIIKKSTVTTYSPPSIPHLADLTAMKQCFARHQAPTFNAYCIDTVITANRARLAKQSSISLLTLRGG